LKKNNLCFKTALRRKDREMPQNFALMAADGCAFSVMATVNPDGWNTLLYSHFSCARGRMALFLLCRNDKINC